MQTLLELLKRCAESHAFDTGDPDNPAVLDQLFRAYRDSHETDPPESGTGCLFIALKSRKYRILFQGSDKRTPPVPVGFSSI